MADGGYTNLRQQAVLTADEAAITLATTQKALWLPAKTLIPTGIWKPGKIISVEAFGKGTTDGTAGNYVFALGLGAGDAPAAIVTGATIAGSTGQTNVTWSAKGYAECRTFGTAGILRLSGSWEPAVALVASTLQPYTMPNATPADITFDFTVGTNALTFQCQRSGAGVWTMTTTLLLFREEN
jgi:hypothetical protein